MTIEETGHFARRAAESGDLEALETALKARAGAIAALIETPASEELAARLRSAIADGEQLGTARAETADRIRVRASVAASMRTHNRHRLDPRFPDRLPGLI